MNLSFKTITGGKFNFIDDQIVKDHIDEAGRKDIVFVEGKTDKRIFDIILREISLDRIEFINTGGHDKVEEYLENILENGIKGFLGIIDRDFMTDSERKSKMNKFKKILYIHEKNTIENCLIREDFLLELIKDHNKKSLDIKKEDIKILLKEILMNLLKVMAGNKILLEYSVGYFSVKTPYEDKKIILKKLYNALTESGIFIEFEELKIKYKEIFKKLNSKDCMDDLHKVVNGKYFMYQFKEEIKNRYKIKITGNKNFIKYSLARILKVNGLTDDFKSIKKFIEDNI